MAPGGRDGGVSPRAAVPALPLPLGGALPRPLDLLPVHLPAAAPGRHLPVQYVPRRPPRPRPPAATLGDALPPADYTAATFGHEAARRGSAVRVLVGEAARRAVLAALDISMFIRTRKPTGQIFYLGSLPRYHIFLNQKLTNYKS